MLIITGLQIRLACGAIRYCGTACHVDVQWVGQEIRILDYLEGQGQVLACYTSELRKRGYGSAECFLPHDGVNTNSITGKLL